MEVVSTQSALQQQVCLRCDAVLRPFLPEMLKFLIMFMSVIVAVLEQELPQLSQGSRQVLQLVVEVDVLLDQRVDGVLKLKRSTTHGQQQHTDTHTAQSPRAMHPEHTPAVLTTTSSLTHTRRRASAG